MLAQPDWCERFQVLGTYTRDLTPAQTGRVHPQRREVVVADRRKVEAQNDAGKINAGFSLPA